MEPTALFGIVVSCQALAGSPLEGPIFMAAMARAAVLGGASAVRVNGPEDVQAVREAVTVPIIGINKTGDRGPDGVYITPTFESAQVLVEAGATVIALDGTPRPRPGGELLKSLIERVHINLGVAVMADVDTLEAGLAAADAGADYVATTLSGATSATACDRTAPPDLRLVGRLVRHVTVPVIAEGRLHRPDDAAEAFALGATAVVVGTAITNPTSITATFVAKCSPYKG
jgi:N-acylglucosamine-6-phosphate 2-epimerase